MTKNVKRAKSKGFTLLELMATMAVIAVGASLAIPSFTSMVKSSRLTSSSNDFIAALNGARNEAIRLSQRVVVCHSINGSVCQTGTWADGWIAFVDENNNGQRNGAEKILLTHLKIHDGYTFAEAPGSLLIKDAISFDDNGLARPAGSSALLICTPGPCELQLRDDAGDKGKDILIVPGSVHSRDYSA